MNSITQYIITHSIIRHSAQQRTINVHGWMLGICLLMLTMLTSLNAQPFTWEYSARMPIATPSMFVGLTSTAGIFATSAVPTMEKSISECNCLQANERGLTLGLAAVGEYWLDNIALTARIGVQYNRMNFGGRNEGFPVRGTDSLFVRESGQLSALHLTFAGGVKYTVFPTNMFLRGEVQGALLLNESMQFTRDIVFNGVERTTTIVPRTLRSVRLSMIVGAGYDIIIGRNMYVSPEIFAGYDASGLFVQPRAGDGQGANALTTLGIRVALLVGIP